MLPCPACRNVISPGRPDQWFQCPKCDCWLRLRVNSKMNTTWLEPGIHANGHITVVQIVQTVPAPGDKPKSQINVLDQAIPEEELSLETILRQRQEIENQLGEIEAEMKRLAGVISADRSNTDTIRRTNEKISKLSEREKALTERDRDLQKQETALKAEQQRQRASAGSSSSSQGWAFGCSTILFAAALITFGIALDIVWSPTAVLYLLGIALAGGFLMWIGTLTFNS